MVNEAIAKAENLDRELSTQKEILKQMELTKKEYIEKLKQELDIIEKRYQHLLGENAMIGEDFRSQAHENLCKVRQLEDKIKELLGEIDEYKKEIDKRDLDAVQWQRQEECYIMNLEEYLTYYDDMRWQRDNVSEIIEKLKKDLALKDAEVAAFQSEIQVMEEAKNKGKKDFGVQVEIKAQEGRGARKPDSSRGSGSLQS